MSATGLIERRRLSLFCSLTSARAAMTTAFADTVACLRMLPRT